MADVPKDYLSVQAGDQLSVPTLTPVDYPFKMTPCLGVPVEVVTGYDLRLALSLAGPAQAKYDSVMHLYAF